MTIRKNINMHGSLFFSFSFACMLCYFVGNVVKLQGLLWI